MKLVMRSGTALLKSQQIRLIFLRADERMQHVPIFTRCSANCLWIEVDITKVRTGVSGMHEKLQMNFKETGLIA